MSTICKAINVLLLLLSIATADDEVRTFPKEFSVGIGSSAYQIEGAPTADGKSENIWDHWIHDDPTHIKNNATADVACNTYYHPEDEASYAVSLRAEHYRFSIPWSRILPTGSPDEINMKAVWRYQTLIRYLRRYLTTPVATLYYNDLPQSLQDMGGWANPNMTKYFEDYARVCFQYFYEVEYWITFNDPRSICRNGYGDGTMAPGIRSDGKDEYACAYNVLKAHAAAYHIYKEEFKSLAGKVSIALDMKWSEPASDKDKDAVNRRNEFDFGLYANPIYKGNWPKVVKERVDFRSKKENLKSSRLPEFTEDEIKYINGTSDFMAVNIYEAHVVEDVDEAKYGDPSYIKDRKVICYLDPSWTLAINGRPILPEAARKTLSWLSKTYNHPQIFITGNGVADNTTSYAQNDYVRINYHRDYLNAIFDAIKEDNVNVIAYTAWSLRDGFEWTAGYSYRTGFYFTRHSYPTLQLEKPSFAFFKKLAQTHTIPQEEPDTTTTTPTTVTSTTTDSTRPTTTTLPDTTTHGSATKITYSSVLMIVAVLLWSHYF